MEKSRAKFPELTRARMSGLIFLLFSLLVQAAFLTGKNEVSRGSSACVCTFVVYVLGACCVCARSCVYWVCACLCVLCVRVSALCFAWAHYVFHRTWSCVVLVHPHWVFEIRCPVAYCPVTLYKLPVALYGVLGYYVSILENCTLPSACRNRVFLLRVRISHGLVLSSDIPFFLRYVGRCSSLLFDAHSTVSPVFGQSDGTFVRN